MASSSLSFSTPASTHLLKQSSFLPFRSISINNPNKPLKNKNTITITISSSSSSVKIVRFPSLDRHASRHNRFRFVSKLQTLLLSKPRHFLPLRVLSRCRSYLSPPPARSLLSMILRYPSIFRLFYSPSFSSPSLSLLSVTLTPAAASLAAHESRLRSSISSSLASKLQRLLMLSPHRRLLLSKLVHLAPDLGFAPNFRSRLCNAHPDRFRIVDTSYGRALELVSWDSSLAVPFPPVATRGDDGFKDRPIIDRPPKFKLLKLRRGLNLKRPHRDFLLRLQELPDVSPYLDQQRQRLMTPEEAEKQACAVVREVLAMTTEKRTLVDHLTHFRKDFGLPNRLHAMLVRHPEMFYVSIKGARDSVFLVEAYDEKGKLLVEDELKSAKKKLVELVNEGKRMRREWKRGYGYGDGAEDESDGDDDLEDDDEDEDDVLQDLFESGIGDDWKEICCGDDHFEEELKEVDEFWIRKALDESSRQGEELLEVW
ncbi:putative plant organelle RNA recognition domain-containing protein [Dioscorea sansibarensis]